MSTIELNSLVESLKEWETLLEDAKEQVESLRDSIKQEMSTRGVEELEVGARIVRWTLITSNRLDAGALKKELPELAAHYTKTVTARRFTISG